MNTLCHILIWTCGKSSTHTNCFFLYATSTYHETCTYDIFTSALFPTYLQPKVIYPTTSAEISRKVVCRRTEAYLITVDGTFIFAFENRN